jgi:hypothetical protein
MYRIADNPYYVRRVDRLEDKRRRLPRKRFGNDFRIKTCCEENYRRGTTAVTTRTNRIKNSEPVEAWH